MDDIAQYPIVPSGSGQEGVLQVLSRKRAATAQEVAAELGMPKRNARKNLMKLVRDGRVTFRDGSRGRVFLHRGDARDKKKGEIDAR